MKDSKEIVKIVEKVQSLLNANYENIRISAEHVQFLIESLTKEQDKDRSVDVKKFIERKITGCIELKGMDREKAIYQSVLKDYRKLSTNSKEQPTVKFADKKVFVPINRTFDFSELDKIGSEMHDTMKDVINQNVLSGTIAELKVLKDTGQIFYTEDIEKLGSRVHKIVGDGEVMHEFNKLLGNNG